MSQIFRIIKNKTQWLLSQNEVEIQSLDLKRLKITKNRKVSSSNCNLYPAFQHSNFLKILILTSLHSLFPTPCIYKTQTTKDKKQICHL